jgi:hypothetical protein
MTFPAACFRMSLLAVLVGPAGATDFSGLYDAATMQYWQGRYTTSTNKIFNLIRTHLKAEEARKLAGVRSIEYPILGEGVWKGEPLAFYSYPDKSRVVFPVLSLKFLDDLCTAYAWLQVNGYVLDTVSEYAAMLRYKPFPDGKYPPPLRALHIPENALQDHKVDELSLDHFVTARAFLLAHELGHVYSGRYAQSLAEARQIEQDADAFAADVMSRIQLPPLGMLVFFVTDASFQGYPPRPTDHPLSGARIQALASRMPDPDLATSLRVLGDVVDDPNTRASIAVTAKTTSESTLMPRRNRLQLTAGGPVGATASAQPFQGRYVGQFVQNIEPKPLAMEMILVRQGNNVTGQFSFGLGNGIITNGTVTGSELRVSWQWAGRTGLGILRATPNGAGFSGTWGFGTSSAGAGTWAGTRRN